MLNRSQSDSSPVMGTCRAKGCGLRMEFRAWPSHKINHQPQDFPELEDGTRALFAVDGYDLTNDRYIGPQKEST